MAETLTIEVIDKGGTASPASTRASAGSTMPGGSARAPRTPAVPPVQFGVAPRSAVKVVPTVNPFEKPENKPGRFPTAKPIEKPENKPGRFPAIFAPLSVGDVKSPMAALSTVISRVVKALGPVGIAAVAVVGTFTAAVVAVKKFSRFVESEVGRLAGLSPELAGAAAMTEIRRLQGDIRRARRIGPDLAKAERLRSKFESSMSDLGTEVLGVLFQLLEETSGAVAGITRIVGGIAKFIEIHGDRIAALLKLQFTLRHPLTALFFKLSAWLEEQLGGDEDDEVDQFTKEFESMLPPPTFAGDRADARFNFDHIPELGV